MSDTNNSGEKTLGGSSSKPTLHLKRPVDAGTVRQSFSHGRSKVVVVEKKRRVLGPGEGGAPAPAPVVAAPVSLAPAKPAAVPIAPVAPRGPTAAPRSATPPPKTGVVLQTLTEEQRDARARALSDARAREDEDRRRQEAEGAVRREREKREKAEREAAEARKREEELRRSQEASFKKQSEEEARRRLAGEPPGPTPPPSMARSKPVTISAPAPVAAPVTPVVAGAAPAPAPAAPARAVTSDSASDARRVVRRPMTPAPAPAKVMLPTPRPARNSEPRNRGRLTVTTATSAEEERTRSVAAFRRRTQRLKGHGSAEQKEKIVREIVLPETITIQDLANRMSERAVDVIKLLMRQGRMVTLTDTLDADSAQLIAEELGHTVRRVAESDVEEGLFATSADAAGHPTTRPAVVTIMGHVDHGKTSLLDAIRNADVVAGEAGGITQHIGAYQVIAPGGAKITFIDTPAHAAFTAMRARGAKVTDIVVLVVAADDGVMPQTIEAIRHAKAANAPIIVAINKIDKPEANPQHVLQELLQHDVQTEEFGGETLAVQVSAKNRTNLDKLLEAIALQAELMDLVADPARNAEGTVIEARLDRGRGPVATVLVQAGTLRVGALIVAGAQWGRVRALLDDKGMNVSEAPPSTPVEVLGFSGAPEAGDRVAVVESEARAREITEYRERQRRDKLAARGGGARTSLSEMMSNLKLTGRKEMPIVVKGDVQGSVEAITMALEKLNTDEVAARVIHGGVGGITESDVTLAEASKAVIIGFNVRAHKEARDLAEQHGIEIRYYNIIYNLVDDVKAAMSGMLPPTLRETMLGNAQILEVFQISKVGAVAGCRITDGVVQRGAHVRLIRDNVVVHEGKLSTLKRFKDEVVIVQAGQECGMAFENYQDMRKGDVIECYNVEEIRRTL